jgi:protease-4
MIKHHKEIFMKNSIVVMLLAIMSLLSGCSLTRINLFSGEEPLKEATLQGSGADKILVVSVNGLISDKPDELLLRSHPSMVQEVVAQLRRAEKDAHVKALLLKINSPGGTVTASDILYNEIKGFKERSKAKVVVSMMDVAASGGYYISQPADYIFAHPTTITGSIGVIFANPGVSGLMDKVGLTMNVNTSGKLKDMGSPFRPPTAEEQAIFQELTDRLAARFIGLVVESRHLQAEQRRLIATARVFLAPEAKEIGLVDRIGYVDEAIAKARELADLPENPRVVVYRHGEAENDTIYNTATRHEGGSPLLATLLSPRSAMAESGFYYLWPASIGQ